MSKAAWRRPAKWPPAAAPNPAPAACPGATHVAAIGLLSGHICVYYRARVACPPTQCPNPCTAPWNSRAAPIPGQIWPPRQHQQQSHVRYPQGWAHGSHSLSLVHELGVRSGPRAPWNPPTSPHTSLPPICVKGSLAPAGQMAPQIQLQQLAPGPPRRPVGKSGAARRVSCHHWTSGGHEPRGSKRPFTTTRAQPGFGGDRVLEQPGRRRQEHGRAMHGREGQVSRSRFLSASGGSK